MKAIPLTKGFAAIVDDDDYDRLVVYKWRALMGNKGIVYAQRHGEKDGSVLMHRQIMDAGPDDLIDHKNFDGLDNRKDNLRFCSRTQNAHHNRVVYSKSYKGVRKNRDGDKYSARIRLGNGRRIHLGSFDTAEEAAKAYDVAAVMHCGEFAEVNFPVVKDKLLEKG
jgi:AP2 domain